ncbi:hypothetical protein TNCV_4650601 [Trichonephila clavipes]|nr:hypothetical protein TNCV_4650601 [Trichonephila clavipes]
MAAKFEVCISDRLKNKLFLTITSRNVPLCAWELIATKPLLGGSPPNKRNMPTKSCQGFQEPCYKRALNCEEIFMDFKSSGEIKRQFGNKPLFEFWQGGDDECSALRTEDFHILSPFPPQ